jgi:formylglycine-generating enzyme required for sulfatase activity
LTYTRQTTRTTLSPSSTAGTYVLYNTAASPAQYQDRSGVAVVVSGTASSVPAVYACNLNNDGVYNSTDDGQNIECGFLSWADGAAYSAWAGLRPMSELEFEKASRGTAVPAADEYVWGGVTAVNISGFTGGGTAAEIATPSNANSTYLNNFGPLRVGVFATSTTTRAQAGASYYGILDLGGGVWERTVTVGNETGRLFTGSHGTGTLDANGDAVQSDWPGTDAVGAGFRGGDWDADPSYMEVSDRYVAALTSSVRGGNSDTRGTRGFRSVRTAP